MKRIMIDPGHAPGDANRGQMGYYEYAGMWKLAGFLKTALERCSFECALSRTENTNPIADERGRLAQGYDLFISEHSNAANGMARGVEVWYSLQRPDDVALASTMSAVVSAVMGNSDRGAKIRQENGMDYYGQIRGAASAGVPHVLLVENGFHDNLVDEGFLLVDDNLKVIAEAQAVVICDHFGVRYVPSIPTDQFPESAAWVRDNLISDGQRGDQPVTRAELWEMLWRYDTRVAKEK